MLGCRQAQYVTLRQGLDAQANHRSLLIWYLSHFWLLTPWVFFLKKQRNQLSNRLAVYCPLLLASGYCHNCLAFPYISYEFFFKFFVSREWKNWSSLPPSTNIGVEIVLTAFAFDFDLSLKFEHVLSQSSPRRKWMTSYSICTQIRSSKWIAIKSQKNLGTALMGNHMLVSIFFSIQMLAACIFCFDSPLNLIFHSSVLLAVNRQTGEVVSWHVVSQIDLSQWESAVKSSFAIR